MNDNFRLIYSNINPNNKLLVDFCLCTRHRPESLYKMLETTYETADDPERIGTSVYFNDDDELSISQLDRYKKFPNVRYYVGPKMEGFISVEYNIGNLMNSSNSHWVCGSQDDTYIISKGWDTQLSNIDINGKYIVVPDKYQLGPNPDNLYKMAEYIPQFFIPNQSWKQYSYWDYIPHPYDAKIYELLKNNGWNVKFIEMYWVHYRKYTGWTEL